MDRKAQMKEYLNSKINPVFERLIIDLLVDMPEDFISFANDWLNTKGRAIAEGRPITSNNDVEVKQVQKTQEKKDYLPDSDESSEEEEGDKVDELLEERRKKMNKEQRSSISAEVYGNFNKKEDFVAKVVPKTEEQKQRIRAKMEQAFMFSVLNDKEMDIVIGAMEECRFSAGDWVIKQGEQGNILYVIEEGNLDCFKKFNKDDAEDTYLKTYEPGEAFGELALLYNAPRAASIKAKTDCLLWSLDRECFNVIVKDAQRKKREIHDEILEKVKIFDLLDPYERSRLGDVTKEKIIKQGETLFEQESDPHNFYIIGHGHLQVKKDGKEIATINAVDYFGELGLIYEHKRLVTAVAQDVVTLIYIEKEPFLRLLKDLIPEFKKRIPEKYGFEMPQ